MSQTIIRRSLWMALVLAIPAAAYAQGSARLLAVEKQFDADQANDQRIVGGTAAKLADNPWQIAIVSARIPTNTMGQFCGGSIIGPRWVATAAHCVDSGTKPSQIAILTGTESLVTGGTRVPATQIIVHPKWDTKTHDFDIALVEVGADLGGTPIVGDTFANEHSTSLRVRLTGWGRTSMSTSAGSKVLQGVEVPYVTRATCNKPASYDGDITGNMICVGLAQGGADSCQGDSGGPATAMIGDSRRLVGIVSWGEDCALKDKYGVYTRVANFGPWVTTQTAGAVKW
jgi:secreted trypsin-like serine protease